MDTEKLSLCKAESLDSSLNCANMTNATFLLLEQTVESATDCEAASTTVCLTLNDISGACMNMGLNFSNCLVEQTLTDCMPIECDTALIEEEESTPWIASEWGLILLMTSIVVFLVLIDLLCEKRIVWSSRCCRNNRQPKNQRKPHEQTPERSSGDASVQELSSSSSATMSPSERIESLRGKRRIIEQWRDTQRHQDPESNSPIRKQGSSHPYA